VDNKREKLDKESTAAAKNHEVLEKSLLLQREQRQESSLPSRLRENKEGFPANIKLQLSMNA